MPLQWNDKIFGVKEENFEALALEAFRFQAENCPVYTGFLQALRVDPASVNQVTGIPFLPVRFFKSHEIKTIDPIAIGFEPQAIFESSGTTGSVNSRHFVKDISFYEESFTKGFELAYGPINQYCIIGLLPSYLERGNSSLVYMVDKLVQLGEHPQSGFYLHEHEQLAAVLQALEKRKQPTLLIGVTFALLDFAEKFSPDSYRDPLQHTIVMETGGMKGRRQEMIRTEIHEILKNSFHLSAVHSEYGMTELLSQAYSKGEGIFNCPPWMKILMRDEEDPFLVKRSGNGTINIIDLANIWSCSFIATDDIGKLHADNSFEVLGRVDGSDLRGCSLMVV